MFTLILSVWGKYPHDDKIIDSFCHYEEAHKAYKEYKKKLKKDPLKMQTLHLLHEVAQFCDLDY